MAGFKINDRKSSEAALKYVIFGGVASGIMLYGMSWLFGLTQSLNLGEIADARSPRSRAQQGKVPEVVFVGVVCMLAGFGYKISAAPFHMWTPDVYEGAPTPVTAFLSVGPKAAGFAVLVRFFADALGARTAARRGAHRTRPGRSSAACLAMATMTVGNLSALGQDNVKRMLAYSSIAHAGYMLLGVLASSAHDGHRRDRLLPRHLLLHEPRRLPRRHRGRRAERRRRDHRRLPRPRRARAGPGRDAWRSSSSRSPGCRRSPGFVGKFYIFAALLRAGGKYADWNWLLAVVGVLNSVVSLFYYARVLRAMYLAKADRPGDVRAPALRRPRSRSPCRRWCSASTGARSTTSSRAR